MKEVESTVFCRIKNEIIFCPITKSIWFEEELQLAKLVTDLKHEEGKKILMKINLQELFETNLKKVRAFKLKDLRYVLVYLWAADPTEKLV